MTVRLNKRAYAIAKQRINQGELVLDRRDDWSEHRPTAQQENQFLQKRGLREYQTWFLGLDDAHDVASKSRYRFPYGDFARVHRCAVLSAESRAGQYKHLEIEQAAAHLHGMLDTALPAQ